MTATRHGRPVIKQPVWKPEIPFYFYAGGLGGASAGLAALSELRGDDELARRAWLLALGGAVVSPALLISDLGVPTRFLHMLRMFKVTSPMSVGSWLLSAFGAATAPAALDAWTGALPRPVGVGARAGSALLGLPLATYAATSAGAAAMMITPPRAAGAARRLAIGGAAAELALTVVMERSLPGRVGRPYHEGRAQLLGRLAKGLTLAGGAAAAVTGRRRAGTVAAGAALTAGAVLERWSVFVAGSQSAADPQATTVPQREAIESGERRGSVRVEVRTP
jgi:polysulfide reductase-like protein